MYSLTNEEDEYYCHIYCGCGRKYIGEEMYICYNCNKIMCRFCISSEYEHSGCKNSCSRNRIIKKDTSNDKKNKCDVCLECPICFSALIKRNLNGNFMYACPYCYYDTSYIKISKIKEIELDRTIGQLQEFSSGAWTIEKLEKTLKNENNEIENKEQLPIKYDDSYISNSNLYSSFSIIMQHLGVALDYSNNELNSINNVEELSNLLKNDLNPKLISNLEQRYNHVIFQHPYLEMQFPNFFDLIPNKSEVVKKCKQCRKIIIQAASADYESESRIKTIKLDIGHLFTKQFPIETIYKIDTKKNVLMIKFYLYEFKEVTLSFKEDETSEVKCVIPENSYVIGSIIPEDEFIYKSSDKSIIVNFKFKESYISNLVKGSYHIFKFWINAEYDRGGVETLSTIKYRTEIKFKI